jgi:hypothetical protein
MDNLSEDEFSVDNLIENEPDALIINGINVKIVHDHKGCFPCLDCCFRSLPYPNMNCAKDKFHYERV